MPIRSICSDCRTEVLMLSLIKLGEKNLCKYCARAYFCDKCGQVSETTQPHALDEITFLCSPCWLKLNQQPLKEETLN